MGTITINVDAQTETQFRKLVARERGVGKGKLGSAVGEALNLWIQQKKQREIRDRQVKLMEQGLYNTVRYKFNRDELYER